MSEQFPDTKRYAIVGNDGEILFESDDRNEAFAYINANPGGIRLLDRTVKPRFHTFAGTFTELPKSMNPESSIGRILTAYRSICETLSQSPFNLGKEKIENLTVLQLAYYINLMGRLPTPVPDKFRDRLMRRDAANGCLTVNEYNAWKKLPLAEDGDRPYLPTKEEIESWERESPHPLRVNKPEGLPSVYNE